LKYSILSTNDPNGIIAAATFNPQANERLTLSYTPGKIGVASIVVECTDRYGAKAFQTINVTVNPLPPKVTAVGFTTDNPTNVSTVTANPVPSDPQGLPVTFTYQWLLNNQPISGQISAMLPLGSLVNSGSLNINPLDRLTVQVTPHDDPGAPFSKQTGTVFTSNAVTIESVVPGGITVTLPS
jgi:hypothetical protein